MPEEAAPWRRLPADVATVLQDRRERTIESVAAAVTAEVPALAEAADPKLVSDAREAVDVAVTRFIELVGTDSPALTPPVREAYVALGAAEARDGRGPDVLLSSLRLSSRLLLRTAVDALSDQRPVDAGEVVALSEALTVFVDELAGAGTEGYARQLREHAGETDRRRRRLAELLVRGGSPEAVVQAEAHAVGWTRLGLVTPVLLPVDRARDARFRFASDGLVLEREDDAVLLVPAGPTGLLEGHGGALRAGAVVGPALSWSQLPEALRLAELTRSLGDPAVGPDGVARTDDVLARLALSGDTGALAVLTERRLAPLADLPEAERERLTTTLRSWLRHWGSRPAVAAELFVHPQTVSYRVARLRELLGPALDDPEARFELQLALTRGV